MVKLRWVAIIILLLLSVAVDFTGRIMSIASDGVIIATVIYLLIPLIKGNKNV